MLVFHSCATVCLASVRWMPRCKKRLTLYQHPPERWPHFVFCLDDKIIQPHNYDEREKFNGRVDIVTSVNAPERCLEFLIEDRTISRKNEEHGKLDLTYTRPVHKS